MDTAPRTPARRRTIRYEVKSALFAMSGTSVPMRMESVSTINQQILKESRPFLRSDARHKVAPMPKRRTIRATIETWMPLRSS